MADHSCDLSFAKTRSWHWTSAWHRATLERNVPRTRSLGRRAGSAQDPYQSRAGEPGAPAATRSAPPPLEATAVGRLDRAFWILAFRRWAGWRKALHVVRPETVIRWHRQGFRTFWTWKSRRGRTGRPPIGSEPAHLIRTMAHANPLWGAPRIHGELLKLGFEVCCFACSGLKGPRSAVAGQPSLLRGDAGSSCAQRQHEAR